VPVIKRFRFLHLAILLDQPNNLTMPAWVIAGERARPPEDVGGVSGYQEMLNVLASEPDSEEAEEHITWTGDDFDSELFDRRAANATLLRVAWNNWGKKDRNSSA
jgi:Plasmid pRiA4b ORF-3-like protein